VEILTACPTGWHVAPQEAIHWVEKNMIPIFPLKVFKDRPGKPEASSIPAKAKAVSEQTEPSEPAAQAAPALGAVARGELSDVAMKLSGFG
jgi:pyruvate/2-oxoacid:ferredoxin oxidoreductase beta subunit